MAAVLGLDDAAGVFRRGSVGFHRGDNALDRHNQQTANGEEQARDAQVLHEGAGSLAVDELTRAAHRYVGRTPSKLMTVQLEDVGGDLNQVNLPGTSEDQHANWRLRPSLGVEDLPDDPRWRTLVGDLAPRFRRGFE